MDPNCARIRARAAGVAAMAAALVLLLFKRKRVREAHPKADPCINKPIEQFDELTLICGDNFTTGSFTKSVGERMGVPMEHMNRNSSEPFSNGVEEVEDSGGNPSVNPGASIGRPRRSGGKRSRLAQDEVDALMISVVQEIRDIGASL